jgi:hypothetical protein
MTDFRLFAIIRLWICFKYSTSGLTWKIEERLCKF